MATNPIINIPPAPSLDISIGSAIGSSTPNSLLFVDADSNLAQGSLTWAEATKALTVTGDIGNLPMLRLVRNEAATISYNTDDGFTRFTTADNNYGLSAPVGYIFAAQGNPEGHLQLVNGANAWSLAFTHDTSQLTVRDIANSVDYLTLTGGVAAVPKLGVGNSAAATTPGTVVNKIEVFDAAGASLGFIAVYDAIT